MHESVHKLAAARACYCVIMVHYRYRDRGPSCWRCPAAFSVWLEKKARRMWQESDDGELKIAHVVRDIKALLDFRQSAGDEWGLLSRYTGGFGVSVVDGFISNII